VKARRQLRIALLGTVAALAAFTFAAQSAVAASSSNPVIADCLSHPGGLTGNYTAKQLTQALQVMPAEVKEYTNCSDVINRALLSAVGKSGGQGGGTGGGSGSFLPTPVIVILVLLILGAVAFWAMAVRRRQAEAGGGADDPRPGGGAGGPRPGGGAGGPPPGD
jgi:hypothetical protein